MELMELKKNWDAFGRTDPLWAIMTQPGKTANRWDPGEFFRTGEGQIRGLMHEIAARGIEVRRGRALDFGCGVGRLTQALGDHFREVDGVDISPAMVERARAFNRHGERCRYHANDRDDLALFPDDTFDLVYSIIVLQHMLPRYALGYIGEFVRVLAPGGLAVFHVPGAVAPAPPKPKAPPSASSAPSAPLPPEAFRAHIAINERRPTLKAGQQFEVRVRVTNRSPVAWHVQGEASGRFALRLANHWLDEHRKVVVQDDGRIDLPGPLDPGASAELILIVTAPHTPGQYLLELDLVQEHVAWFARRGSESAVLPVDVVPEAQAGDFEPEMQMHVVEKSRVIAAVEARGGRIVDVEQPNEGSALIEYNYYVTK